MKNTKIIKAGALAAAVAITLAASATTHAASILWGAPTGITGDANVSTAGSLVGAFNLGSNGDIGGGPVASTTVNGVLFQGLGIGNLSTAASSGNFSLSAPAGFLMFPNGTFGSAAAPFSSLSASYQTLLNSAATIDTPNTFTLTMSSLTAGQQYQFQWWANTSGPGFDTHTGTAGNSVTLIDNTTAVEGGVGQFAIGTFTADAASQDVVFSAGAGPGAFAQVNGFQLRNVTATSAVPETSNLLIGLGLVAVIGLTEFGRKRRMPSQS